MVGGPQWTGMYKPERKHVCKFLCDPNGYKLTCGEIEQLKKDGKNPSVHHFFIILTPSDTEKSHDCVTAIPLSHKGENEIPSEIIIPLEAEYIRSPNLPKESLILCSRITRVRREYFDREHDKYGIITDAGMTAIKEAIIKFLDRS